ncbi:TPA: winged helix domain-containing protein [Escherichia coli]
MKKLLRLFFPLSLRVRFLLATAAVVLVLSLAYGMVALIGYSVSFDKTTFRLLRGESNLFYTLAKWENNKLHVELPENIDKQSPTMTLIYDENGQLLWAQRDVPWLMKMIQPDWLKSNGFHEIEADVNDTSLLLSGDHSIQQQLQEVREDDDDAEMTHSVAVNVYPATSRMPKLTIVVVDTIPVELKSSYMVWSWFIYVLSANLLLVIPLLWVAAWWSLRPIEALAKEVRELEEHNRELLNPATTRELISGFADYVLQRELGGNYYSDPDVPPRAHPADVLPQEMDKLREMMLELINQPEHFKQWFGEFISQSRHELDIAPPEPPYQPDEIYDALKQGDVLVRLGGLRVLRIGDDVYANGEKIDSPHRPALDALASNIALTAENFGDALEDPSFLAMLAALVNSGYWFFEG